MNNCRDSYFCIDPNHEKKSLVYRLCNYLRPRTLEIILEALNPNVKTNVKDVKNYSSFPFGKETPSKITNLVLESKKADALEAVKDFNASYGNLSELDGLKENLKFLTDYSGNIGTDWLLNLKGTLNGIDCIESDVHYIDFKVNDKELVDEILRIKIDESDINSIKISYDCSTKDYGKKILLLKKLYNQLTPSSDVTVDKLTDDDVIWIKVKKLLMKIGKTDDASFVISNNPNTGKIVYKKESSVAKTLCDSINRAILSGEVDTLTDESLEFFSNFSSDKCYILPDCCFQFESDDATLTMDFVPSFDRKSDFDVSFSFDTDDFHERCELIEALNKNIMNCLGKKVAILYGNGGGGDTGETEIN